jgi:molybdopterin-guanine dinucleotide biosynthesis protein MobB
MGGLPALAICGAKNSGKTTLLEAVLPRLLASGLQVVVLKEAGQQLQADRPGKDSDRLFQTGADVLCLSSDEQFLRQHGRTAAPLEVVVNDLAEFYDLVLVEGHRGTALPTVWLAAAGEATCPRDVTNVLAVLPRDGARPAALLAILDEWLPKVWRAVPVYAGLLIGGASTRMGSAKHLLRIEERTWLERTVERLHGAAAETVLLGRGEVPASLAGLRRLADVPEASGPMAGLLSAMRWAPRASWLIVACDLPQLSREAVDWLLGCRQPGRWAVLPRLAGGGHLEPLLALYDFRARTLLERLAAAGCFRMADIARSASVATPAPPPGLAVAWTNVNCPGDLAGLQGGAPDRS